MPRPPDTTTAASSSFGPSRSSTWRSSTLASPARPASGVATVTTSAAPPPLGSAALAGPGGESVGVRPDEDRFHGVGELTGLGEDLERRARRLVAVGLGEDPDLGNSHCSAPTSSADRVSDDFELLEELHDALERLAVVLDLLAGLALGRGADRHDLLTGARPADLVGAQAEVARGHLVDRLVLRRHDPLERGVAGLDHTGGHAHHRGQRRLDL